ncbi:TPA: histidine--tRNA ligase [Patescibacteria group bacterium]|nr:histidine--tRNA ligase [Patescibacteria group bacterium]
MPKDKKTIKKVVASKPKKKGYQSVKGMHDILPKDQLYWDKIRTETKNLADYYHYGRIDTPLVEQADLFEKGVGEATDIVEKQMFVLKGGKDKLVLRPEGTASVVRAYLQHGLTHRPQPVKLYYIGPMFRKERPQEGRFRQFHQAGFEIIGDGNDAIYDAQIVLSCYRLLESLKIKKLDIQINTIGCKACRPDYRRRLVDYYKKKKVCNNCERRLKTNPLRILDCKDNKCQEFKKDAPVILDCLCADCKSQFKGVLEYLEELGLPYSLNNYLVRGLDYYNQTVFEIFAEGFDGALASGGRYDYLAKILGGKDASAVGVGIGLERVIAVMKKNEVKLTAKQKPKVFFIHVGSLAKKKSLGLIEELKNAGVRIGEALGKGSLKAQLRQADKDEAVIALIFGQKEAFEKSIIIRDLATGSQESVLLDKFIKEVKKKLK